MRWILLDIAIVGLSLVLLGVTLLRLWRKVQGLGRTIARAGAVAEQAAEGLALTRAPASAAAPRASAPISGRTPPRHR